MKGPEQSTSLITKFGVLSLILPYAYADVPEQRLVSTLSQYTGDTHADTDVLTGLGLLSSLAFKDEHRAQLRQAPVS